MNRGIIIWRPKKLHRDIYNSHHEVHPPSWTLGISANMSAQSLYDSARKLCPDLLFSCTMVYPKCHISTQTCHSPADLSLFPIVIQLESLSHTQLEKSMKDPWNCINSIPCVHSVFFECPWLTNYNTNQICSKQRFHLTDSVDVCHRDG